ncbi:MAG: CHAT domain-containing protein [Acidobacteria bacterium]|nr:CHAT domain-containing protein [Acidobacteriota bacterium]
MAATLSLVKSKTLSKNYHYLIFSIAIILILIFSSNSYANTQDSKVLEPNKPVDRILSNKEPHIYSIPLKKQDFLVLTVDQLGIDIIVEVIDPNGQKLDEVSDNSKGQEALVMIADMEGDYKIRLIGVEDKSLSVPTIGHYIVKIQEQRPSTKQDRALLQGRELEVLAEIAFSQGIREKFLEAIKNYEQALELFQIAENKKEQAKALRGLALCYYSLNENLKSIDYYEKSLAIWKELGEQYSVATTLLAIGGVYYVIDDFQTALNYYEQSLPLWIEVKNRYGEGYTLAAIGNAKVSTGDYFKAIECYYQAIVAYQAINEINAEASARFSLSNAFYLLGQYDESLNNYQQTLDTFRSTGDKEAEANTLASMGLVYAALEKKDDALDSYNKAIEKYKEKNIVVAEAFTRLGISSVYLFAKEFDKAIDQGNQSLDIFLKYNDKRGEAIALSNIGLVQFNAGEKEKAKENYQKSLDIFRSLGYRSGEAAMLYGLASVARDTANLAEAKTKIEAALKIVDSPTLKITEQEIREFNFTTLRSYFDLYIDVLMQLSKTNPNMGYQKQAFQVNERARNRFLQDILTNIRPTINDVSPQLIAQERKVNQLIRNKIRSQMKLLSADYSPQQLGNITRDLEKFSAEYEQIQKEIKQKAPIYGQLVYPDPIALNETQKLLDKDTILLEYWLGDQHSYLWVITPNKVESFELSKKAEIEDLARKFHLCLSARNSRIKYEQSKPVNQRPAVAEADPLVEELSNTLSQILLKPIADKLGKSKLLIVGEGALHFIPFAALVDPVDETKKVPLLIAHEINILPSAHSLTLLNSSTSKTKLSELKVALFADPILSVDDERLQGKGKKSRQENAVATDILKSLKDPARLSVELAYRAADDTDVFNNSYRIPRLPLSDLETKQITTTLGKEKIKQTLGDAFNRVSTFNPEHSDYQVTHLSSYALINSKNPAISGIALSLFDNDAKEQDNFLKLKDLYNLPFTSQLLVISAGGTTMGKNIRSEGFYALTRGLIHSGTKQTLLSLWTIKDESRVELMSRFYQGLAKNLQPAQALRAAQIAIWEQKRWQAPYYWAPFVIVGNTKNDK